MAARYRLDVPGGHTRHPGEAVPVTGTGGARVARGGDDAEDAPERPSSGRVGQRVALRARLHDDVRSSSRATSGCRRAPASSGAHGGTPTSGSRTRTTRAASTRRSSPAGAVHQGRAAPVDHGEFPARRSSEPSSRRLQDQVPARDPTARSPRRSRASSANAMNQLRSLDRGADRERVARAGARRTSSSTDSASAVKVQHRDIDRIVRLDLKTIRRIMQIVQFFVPVQGLDAYYHQIKELLTRGARLRAARPTTSSDREELHGGRARRLPAARSRDVHRARPDDHVRRGGEDQRRGQARRARHRQEGRRAAHRPRCTAR